VEFQLGKSTATRIEKLNNANSIKTTTESSSSRSSSSTPNNNNAASATNIKSISSKSKERRRSLIPQFWFQQNKSFMGINGNNNGESSSPSLVGTMNNNLRQSESRSSISQNTSEANIAVEDTISNTNNNDITNDNNSNKETPIEEAKLLKMHFKALRSLNEIDQ
jgi:hypothetical protein